MNREENDDHAEYWENRYKRGGTSGRGSIGELGKWKWEVIEKFAKPTDDLIDVGCGDLSFWTGRDFPGRYTGIDVSQTIIERNRKSRPNLKFLCSSADELVDIGTAGIVFCLDVLFHIMDDQIYEKTLSNLTKYSSDWIFIYTWSKSPFSGFGARVQKVRYDLVRGRIRNALSQFNDITSDGRYQRHRKLDVYFPIFERAGFELKAEERKEQLDEYGSFYVFRLKRTEGNRL